MAIMENTIQLGVINLIAMQQTAQLELLNLKGKTNKSIINLALQAQAKFNFKYDGENLNTYAKWKQLGYQVQRGEKAFIQCSLWTPCKSKAKKEDDKKENDKEEHTRMYLKKSSLFTFDQVQKIA